MGIGEAIKEDHDEFRRVLTRIEDTSEKEVELRKQLVPHFKRILYAHHVAEEEVLFPAMQQRKELEDMALDLTEEHRAMIILLNDLELSGWSFIFWRYRLRPFREIIAPHWKKEEVGLIPHMPTYFSQAEIDRMSAAFDVVRERELAAR
ncbi:MAG: hemerythrin domain-containing protein [Halobacteriota archaeon]